MIVNKSKKQIQSPEEVVQICKKYFNQERKSVFLLTLIVGIIAHFLLLSKLILSQDGLLNGIHYTAGGYEASIGRWGINLFDSLRNNIAVPFITTLNSILIMGFINLLVIDLFEIKSKIFKILTILSVVLAPSLCMTLLYSYTADAYLLAMFFSLFTVYAFDKIQNKKWGTIFGMASFIMMLATYQSYMGITVGLILMLAVKKLISEKNSSLSVLKELFLKAILLIFSAILYLIITKILLHINGLTMSTYKGTNEISISSILVSLVPSIKNAYLAFFKYFFADGIILNRAWRRETLFLILFALFFVIYLGIFIKVMKKENRSKEIWVRFLLATVLLMGLPIALNLVVILAPGNEIYYLIATQMILIFPLILTMFEKLNENSAFENLVNWAVVIISSVILITYFLSIVVTYQTIELTYNQAKTVANRIVSRMEQYSGYRSGMNKLFAGVIDDVNFPKTLDIYNLALTNGMRSSILHATYWGQEKTWKNFMNLYCGIPIEFCKDYEYYSIVNSEEFKQMDIFPGENSVKIIQDVMVVKFTQNPNLPPMSQEMADRGIVY